MQLPQLKRIRWAVRAALILGVAASVAANILHAQPNPISQSISAWPPLALLLTVELTSRIPMHKRGLAAVRVLATVAIAGIAAWVSYWHMQDVAVRFGETETSAYLLPISVDGLIVVASVSLVELAGRIRVVEYRRAEAAGLLSANPAGAYPHGHRNANPTNAGRSPVAEGTPTPIASAQVAPVQFVPPAQPASVPIFQPVSAGEPTSAGRPAPAPLPAAALADAGLVDAASPGETVSRESGPAGGTEPARHLVTAGARAQAAAAEPPRPLSQIAPLSPAVAAVTRPAPAYANGSIPPARPTVARAAVSTPARTVVTAPTMRPGTTSAAEVSTPRQRRPVQETADLADEIEAMHPNISQIELAKRLGISPTRLRAVRREAREVRRAGASAR